MGGVYHGCLEYFIGCKILSFNLYIPSCLVSEISCSQSLDFSIMILSILFFISAFGKADDCKKTKNLKSLYSSARSLVKNGSFRSTYAKKLPGEVLEKWSSQMEANNISILLFYDPGPPKKSFFGFVLQMHFDLMDVKNHFNMIQSSERVGLDSQISTIRSVYSVYKDGGDERKDDRMISEDIRRKLRDGKGPATPILASNCVCF